MLTTKFMKCLTNVYRRRGEIIKNHVDAYNERDTERMIEGLDPNLIYEEIKDNQFRLRIYGVNAFKKHVVEIKDYFEREDQRITMYRHYENYSEVKIEYFSCVQGKEHDQEKKRMNLKCDLTFYFEEYSIIRLNICENCY